MIYSLNGKAIETVADLNTAAAQFKPGTAAVLHLERAGTLIFSRSEWREVMRSWWCSSVECSNLVESKK